MTLLDAPAFDEARERRRKVIFWSAAVLLVALVAGWWLAAGRPVDWPWNWNNFVRGKSTADRFLTAVERNDLPTAYGIWMNDKDWRQHPVPKGGYSLGRFEQDWGARSPDNEYGSIESHKIVAARMYGNVLLMAIIINGQRTKALDLDYDPAMRTLNFSPPDVEIDLGP